MSLPLFSLSKMTVFILVCHEDYTFLCISPYFCIAVFHTYIDIVFLFIFCQLLMPIIPCIARDSDSDVRGLYRE